MAMLPIRKEKKYSDGDDRILNLTKQFVEKSALPLQTMWE